MALAQCHRCGNSTIITLHGPSLSGTYYISCSGCVYNGPVCKSSKEAIEGWNDLQAAVKKSSSEFSSSKTKKALR